MVLRSKKNMKRAAKVFALTAAVGGAELVLDGGSANAEIVTGSFGVLSATSGFSISITNIPGGGTASADLNAASPFSWSYFSATLMAAQTAMPPGSSSSTANPMSALVAGDPIGAGLAFADYAQLPNGFDGYIGFRFNNGGDNHYGWVRAVGNGDGSELSLTQWGYEDEANTSINAGAVPEPSSLLLLAMGAGGLATYRRRKR